jgi:hypothetical protein
MPRGVYDRSKLKKNAKSTETIVETKGSGSNRKGKPGKKTGLSMVTQEASFHALHMLHEARNNLATLSSLPSNPFIQAQIDENVRQMDKYTKEVFGITEVKSTETVVETKTTSNGSEKVVALPPRVVPPPPLPIA